MMSVDVHSHILPGIDDGSRNSEQSLAMLAEEAKQGITHVVATPHFYARHSDPDTFLAKRAVAVQVLERDMAGRTDLPQIILGAEVHYFSGIGESEHLARLTIENTRLVLIEMPMPPWTESMYRDLENIYLFQGLTPVIAHVDRYIRPLHTYGIPKRLEQLPVLVQANAEFFLEPATAGMALRMLKKGQIHLLGSDCHNLSDRAPNLGEAHRVITQKLGKTGLSEIHRFEAILCGE
ncbi:MAG: capsular polysaccharide biosynthesis protein [Ruminococcaceae bacterium]|nr:capsular polysaccharide biosynthesis protein [Oscillospiraceae bacterium]